MSILSEPHFHNEVAAIAWLEAIVWPKGAFCPRCGGFDRITEVRGGRAGLRRCGPCKREFTVTIGTLFESSHIKIHKWAQAAHLIASSKKGISAHQLHRTLRVTYKTAWFMEHRLREAMRDGHFATQLGGESKAVEIDETFVGGLEKNKHRSKRQHLGTGGAGKEAVFSLVERGGKVRSHHVPAVTGKKLRPIVEAQIHGATCVMTDEGGAAKKVGSEFARHGSVNHSAGEYVRGDVHTNTIEGYFSILKRAIYGTYHHVSQQHLKRYLAEFDFRYNERSALGIEDAARTSKVLSGWQAAYVPGLIRRVADQDAGNLIIMARIRVRFVINQGRHGAPMTKLGKISEQAENFSKRWRLIARLKAILANGSR